MALIAPYLSDDQLTVVPKLVSIAYPLGDILLLAAAIRLAVDAGKRAPAFYLLASSIVTLLLTDFVYGLVTLNGTYTGQLWLDAGWIVFYLLWGAAALHPSMRELEQAAPERDMRLRPLRLGLLLTAAVIAPVIEMAQELMNTDRLIVVNIGVDRPVRPRRRAHRRPGAPAGTVREARAHPARRGRRTRRGDAA